MHVSVIFQGSYCHISPHCPNSHQSLRHFLFSAQSNILHSNIMMNLIGIRERADVTRTHHKIKTFLMTETLMLLT